MHTVNEIEAENTLSSLLDKAEAGEVTQITRNGKPVARLEPASARFPAPTPAQIEIAKAAAVRIRKRAEESKSGPFDWEEWKAYRDEGRKYCLFSTVGRPWRGLPGRNDPGNYRRL